MNKRQPYTTSSEQWLEYVAELRGNISVPLLQSVIQLYENDHSYLLKKGLGLADILLSLGLDNETLAAALVYPLLKIHYLHLDDLNEKFSEAQRKLLRDVMYMQSLGKLQQLAQRDQHQTEKLRKMLLAMVTDVRSVLMVLSERLWELRQARGQDSKIQQQLAHETLQVHAPLANRLGVWQLKWEIEDFCLRYSQPEVYSKIAKWLASRRQEREAYVQRVITELTNRLKQTELHDFEVTGRVKHIYSIYKKMLRKSKLEDIYDASAVRVIVSSIEDCYAVLSLLHHQWEHIDAEFDDYISRPKPNGYRSIHTVLYGPEQQVIEVQIRTRKMHEESELGVAAHWQYKEGVLQTAGYEAKIALLRQIMAWQKEWVDNNEINQAQPLQDLFADRVYVFTPHGDIIDLPQGATPLDFAYHVHSEVGHRCRGAKVNGNIVPLTYQLQTGERVEIITAKQANPSRDWLNPQLGYLKSSRAINKCQHWFRLKDSVQNEEPLREVVEAPPPVITRVSDHKPVSDIQISGIDKLLTHVAKCCKPLPGDEIIGYITRSRGVSIHRRDCNNINRMSHLNEEHRQRLVVVNWGEKQAETYPVDLKIKVINQASVLRDITSLLANEKINIVALQTRKIMDSEEADIYLSIEIASVQQLSKALRLLQQLPNIVEVWRW